MIVARVLTCWTSLLLLTLLSGCAGRHTESESGATEPRIVWPNAPEPARIAYSNSIHSPSEIGIRASRWTRFGRWLTGSDKGNEPLIKPFGISVDPDGNVCLTDTGANVVCYYDRLEKKWLRWEKAGKIQFVSPVSAVHAGGRFFVADSGLKSVIAFDRSGALLGQFTNGLARPSGLAIVDDSIFVTDSQRHCVMVLDFNGRLVRHLGQRGNRPGEFNFPTHIAVDSEKNLYVTDSMNSRVQVLATDGKCKGEIGTMGDSPGQFSRPKGIAVDTLGHVYVIDALFDNIQIFDRTGKFLLTLGAAGAQPGEFWLPNGIAITRNNEIFVTDSYNGRIQVFRYIGPT